MRNWKKRKPLYETITALRKDRSMQEVAEELNKQKLTTLTGKPWNGYTVSSFIRNYQVGAGITTKTKIRRFRNTAPTKAAQNVDALDLAEMIMASNLGREKKRGMLSVMVG